MKQIKQIILSSILISLILLAVSDAYGKKVKVSKIQTRMEAKALKYQKKGALAVVGIAVSNATRPDMGKRKAIAAAQQEMAEASRALVEATTHSFLEEVGIGLNSEQNDLAKIIIDITSSKVLKGAMVEKFDYYQARLQKKNNTATYYVLYVINPKTIYKSMEMALQNHEKGSEENLYQRYVDSEAKKEHDAKVTKFQEEFGIN